MSSVLNRQRASGSAAAVGYFIENAALLASTARFTRTMAGADTDTTRGIFSFWLKRSILSARQEIYFEDAGYGGFGFDTGQDGGDVLYVNGNDSASVQRSWKHDGLMRDPSGNYHCVISIDMNEATHTNKIYFYINGVLRTTSTVLNAGGTGNGLAMLGASSKINFAIGETSAVGEPILSQFVKIESVSVQNGDYAITDFGETNPDGFWIPKDISNLTFGTNGFYLDFAASGDLGNDVSGNNNDWTVNGTITQVSDTPTDSAAKGTANWATMNPLDHSDGNAMTLSNGNLTATRAAAGNAQVYSPAMFDNTGIWYAEIIAGADIAEFTPGVITGTGRAATNRYMGQDATTYGHYSDGRKINAASYTAYGDAWATGEVVGIEIDTDNGTINFWNEGVDQGEAFSGLSGPYRFACSAEAGGISTWAFSEADLTHLGSVTGAKALGSVNTVRNQTGVLADHLWVTTYVGDGSASKAITGCPFNPSLGSLAWVKDRTNAYNHRVQDTIRGAADGFLSTDTTAATATANGRVISFDSAGITVGYSSVGADGANGNLANHVAYCFNLPNTVTSGWAGSPTITPSKEIYNADLGMSVVEYTGDGVNGSIPHSLGVAPKMVIIKKTSAAGDWVVGHTGIHATFSHYILLNSTAAKSTVSAGAKFNDTAPTSTLVSLGTDTLTNLNTATYVALIFAESDFCKPFSYTGNGNADGPFINLSGSVQWSMVKQSSAAGENWLVHDSVRDTYNPTDKEIYANTAGAEATGGARFDQNSNGLKVRNAGGPVNTSSATYIGLAFVEPEPLKAPQLRAR